MAETSARLCLFDWVYAAVKNILVIGRRSALCREKNGLCQGGNPRSTLLWICNIRKIASISIKKSGDKEHACIQSLLHADGEHKHNHHQVRSTPITGIGRCGCDDGLICHCETHTCMILVVGMAVGWQHCLDCVTPGDPEPMRWRVQIQCLPGHAVN